MTRLTKSLTFGLGIAFASFCAAGNAATLNVPAQYPTIQAAITAANPGDTVLIANGTYTGTGNVGLDYGGKAITVTSQNGPAATIIECKGTGQRGFVFHAGETSAAKLLGVTIQDGLPTSGVGGGAIEVLNGSLPTIVNCVFSNCTAGQVGGAVYSDVMSAPTITDCVFLNNYANLDGGGAFISGTATVTGCTFTGNQATALGAGVCFGSYAGVSPLPKSAVSATATGCTFIGNSVNGGNGGGVYSLVGSLQNVVSNCVFLGNTASGNGGAVGGSAILVTNCTTYGNAASQGAGMSLVDGVTNCILYGDNGPELLLNATVTNCDVQGVLAAGTGNLSVLPQFVRTPSLGGATPDYGDLHLLLTSPCAHAGTAEGAPPVTIDGVTRPASPSMGAYETGPVHLTDNADSYVQDGVYATQNYGSLPTILVSSTSGTSGLQLGYVKFDLTSLNPFVATTTVKLSVAASLAQAGTSSLIVYATPTNWAESNLIYNGHPPLGTPLGFLNLSGTATATYSVDVTPYVLAQRAAGATQVSFALYQYGSGPQATILSKENVAGTPPQLVVTY